VISLSSRVHFMPETNIFGSIFLLLHSQHDNSHILIHFIGLFSSLWKVFLTVFQSLPSCASRDQCGYTSITHKVKNKRTPKKCEVLKLKIVFELNLVP
jgi:hypothetical protein